MQSTATALQNENAQGAEGAGQQLYENLGDAPKTALPQAPTDTPQEGAPQEGAAAAQATQEGAAAAQATQEGAPQAQTDGPALAAPASRRASLVGALAGPTASLSNVNADLKRALYQNAPPALDNALQQVELKTGAKREQLAYGAIGLLSLYLILGSAAQLVCNLIGFAYPAYASVLAIRSPQKDDDTQWLTYWSVFASFSLLDFFSEGIMSLLPIYWLAKATFLLYLALPQTQGADALYRKVVDPAVSKLDALLQARAQKAQ